MHMTCQTKAQLRTDFGLPIDVQSRILRSVLLVVVTHTQTNLTGEPTEIWLIFPGMKSLIWINQLAHQRKRISKCLNTHFPAHNRLLDNEYVTTKWKGPAISFILSFYLIGTGIV